MSLVLIRDKSDVGDGWLKGVTGMDQRCRTFAHGHKTPSIDPLYAAVVSHPCRTYGSALTHFGTRIGGWVGLCTTMSQLRPLPEINRRSIEHRPFQDVTSSNCCQ